MTFDLSPYDHIALDMNGTFVFDYDRFGPEQDFGATYRRLGFDALPARLAHEHVRACYDYLAPRYVDPEYYHRFPTVAHALRESNGVQPLCASHTHELVETFTEHELGELPIDHAAALWQLSEQRPLSVISNLWAPKDHWLTALVNWDVAPCFQALTFSSDGPHIKPHPAIFRQHLRGLGLSPKRVLYVGDSHRCDVAGARGAGMDAVWLTQGAPSLAPDDAVPVAIFDNLCTFAAACVHSRPV